MESGFQVPGANKGGRRLTPTTPFGEAKCVFPRVHSRRCKGKKSYLQQNDHRQRQNTGRSRIATARSPALVSWVAVAAASTGSAAMSGQIREDEDEVAEVGARQGRRSEAVRRRCRRPARVRVQSLSQRMRRRPARPARAPPLTSCHRPHTRSHRRRRPHASAPARARGCFPSLAALLERPACSPRLYGPACHRSSSPRPPTRRPSAPRAPPPAARRTRLALRALASTAGPVRPLSSCRSQQLAQRRQPKVAARFLDGGAGAGAWSQGRR